MPVRIGARQAQNQFSHLLDNVHDSNEEVIIEQSGKPIAAVIPVTMYERMIAEREARFQVLERIRSKLPDAPPDEVEKDVAEAIAAVRNGYASRGA